MATKLRAAVVGVGYLGRFHAQKYQGSASADLVCVVDANPDRASEIGSELNVPSFSDYKKLPELGVQCASVASNTSTHFEIAKWLVENGIDVLVEKPITVTSWEAKELVRIAAENNQLVQVGLLERFNPAFRGVKQLLTKPMFIEARRIAPFSARGHDVDVIRDLMIHDIDIIAHLIDRPLVEVQAVGVPVLTDSVDICNARLVFEGGAVANVTASRAAFKSERTIRMFQQNVYVSLDFGKKSLKMYSKTGEKDERGFPRIHIEEQTVGERDALADEIESFLSCVRDRRKPEVTGEDGLRALEVADAIEKAVRENLCRLDVASDLMNTPESSFFSPMRDVL